MWMLPLWKYKLREVYGYEEKTFLFQSSGSVIVMSSQDSWLKTHDSRLMTQDSWLKTHDSRLMTQDSWLKTHDSRLMTQDSWLKTHDPQSADWPVCSQQTEERQIYTMKLRCSSDYCKLKVNRCVPIIWNAEMLPNQLNLHEYDRKWRFAATIVILSPYGGKAGSRPVTPSSGEFRQWVCT